MSFTVTFWGVRGSIATPGPDTIEFGGNTSCVEVQAGGQRVIFDTGTGIRLLGQKLLRERQPGAPLSACIFYSHVHWDHIQGLPFFTPLFIPGTQLHFYGPQGDLPLREVLSTQMSYPFFPVRLGDLASSHRYTDLQDGARVQLGADVTITCARLNHPNGVLAYRVDCAGHAVVYATDTEHYSCVDPKLVRLAQGADLLIYDAMYDDDEYAGRRGAPRTGWGHSTWTEGVRVADAAGVGRLVLFHHDPAHDDACVRAIEQRAQQARPGTVAAREGQTLAVAAAPLTRAGEGVAA
jgi:phosphoribosyl 1,2-cyclic phosphodiesterase